MSILVSDPLALIAIEAGQVGTPLVEGAANGDSKLDSQQRAATIGEPVPIVFCRRNDAAGTGGVLISPAATEARFENDTSNAVTAFYHLVLSEGQIGSIQVRDVFQRSCRVGSYTQTYGRRAGTWTPGNYIVTRAGYTTPVCPYYCGSVGTYTGMTTLSFQVTIPDGFDLWNRQVHAFIRNGMQVTRLVDGVTGSSSNFADLVNWCYVNSSRLPSSLIDTTALTAAANFMETVGLACDVNITESTNLGDMLAKMAPYLLVTETRNLGKRGLRPLLPVTAGNAIKTTAISWEFTFTEDHILLDSFEISYIKLADRKPFCVQMIWRQQPTDDVGMIRTSEVRYAGTAETGPYEQHDLSQFCTSENHAVKVGTYILARRRYISHTLRFSVRPEIYNTTLVPGDIVRVTLQRVANITQASTHDYLYEVNRVTKTLAGDLTFELTHIPVDSQGRSLVALDVANAVGTGVMLTSNRTGISCDVNSSADTTVPVETYTTATALDSQVTFGSRFESYPGVAVANTSDGYDKNQGNTYDNWPDGYVKPTDADWPSGLTGNTDPAQGAYIVPATGAIDNGVAGYKTQIAWAIQSALWERNFFNNCVMNSPGAVQTGSISTYPNGSPLSNIKGVFKYFGPAGSCGGVGSFQIYVVRSSTDYSIVGYQLGTTTNGWQIYQSDVTTTKIPL